MILLTPTALFLAVLAAMPAAPSPDPDPSGDLARLQGRWTTRAGPKGNIPVVLEVAGRRASVRITTPQGLKIHAEGSIRIDESAAPKELDWVEFTAPDGQGFPEVLGIYEFDGESLRVCNGGLHDARPDAFRPGEGLIASVLVFNKEEPGGKPPAVGHAPRGDRSRRSTPGAARITRRAADLPPTIVAVAAWLTVAAAADDSKVEGDLAAIQGSWTAMGGPNKNVPIALTLKGPDATVTFTTRQNGKVEFKGKVALDESKSPRTLDWTGFTGPMGNAAPDNLAIYSLDEKGTQLRICSGGPGNERPERFEEGDGGPPHILIFRRPANDSGAAGVK